jgi:hypothetical protein
MIETKNTAPLNTPYIIVSNFQIFKINGQVVLVIFDVLGMYFFSFFDILKNNMNIVKPKKVLWLCYEIWQFILFSWLVFFFNSKAAK